MSLVVITDRLGKVIAAALLAPKSRAKVVATLAPRPGQTLHEVEMPDYMVKLAPKHQLLAALEHRVPKGAKRLQKVTRSGQKKRGKGG
jgi:hypothetical protein